MYFPKSQIKTNQYTNGGEFSILSSDKMYKGFYFSTSKEEFFSGKTPNEPDMVKLKRLSPESGKTTNQHHHSHSMPNDLYIGDESYYSALNIKGKNKPPRNPISSFPINPKKDFKRYFASKTNEIKFIEISKTEYSKFKDKSAEVNWTLYTPIEIDWKVEGTREEVYLKNKETVHKTLIPGFDLYFREKYDKFWSS